MAPESPAPGSSAPGSPAQGSPASGEPTPTAVDPAPSATQGDDDAEEYFDVSELEDASDVATTGVARLTQAFPGAVVVDDESTDGARP